MEDDQNRKQAGLKCHTRVGLGLGLKYGYFLENSNIGNWVGGWELGGLHQSGGDSLVGLV